MGSGAGQERGPRARGMCTRSEVGRGTRGAMGRRSPHRIGAMVCTWMVTPGAGAITHTTSRGHRGGPVAGGTV